MTEPRPVRLSPSPAPDTWLTDLAQRTHEVAGGGVPAAVAWAVELGRQVPDPGTGGTARRWEALATIAAQDLTVARVLEAHLDALAILHEQGSVAPDGSYGVYAAEGPGVGLAARETEAGWRLDGTKPWCSLAGVVSHALITAWIDGDQRGLFLVDLGDSGVSLAEGGVWAPTGLTEVVSTGIELDDVPATAVGGPGWYLRRPGFAWGGIGVAAVWYGGAVGLARRVADGVTGRVTGKTARREPDQIALMHLGAVDAALWTARAVLGEAATVVESGTASGADASLLAARVRHAVVSTAETVLTHAAHALGPAPLSQEPEHARRVADLSLYLRQHHAERDAVASGRMVGTAATAPW